MINQNITNDQSATNICPSDAIELYVSSLTDDGGNPSPNYQWYSNTTNSNTGGTLLTGETGSSYFPTLNTPGTYYYYCVVYSGQGGQNINNGPHSNVITITVDPLTVPGCATPATPADGSNIRESM